MNAKMPITGTEMSFVYSIGATGRDGVSPAGSSTMTLPPQQSTAALMFFSCDAPR